MLVVLLLKIVSQIKWSRKKQIVAFKMAPNGSTCERKTSRKHTERLLVMLNTDQNRKANGSEARSRASTAKAGKLNLLQHISA